MQKIATRVFIYSSIAFGIIGVILVIFSGPNDNTPPNPILFRLLWLSVFFILPSFALSVASKYLGGGR